MVVVVVVISKFLIFYHRILTCDFFEFLHNYSHLANYVSVKAQCAHKNIYAIIDGHGTTVPNEILWFGVHNYVTFFDGCFSGFLLNLGADIGCTIWFFFLLLILSGFIWTKAVGFPGGPI